jgi:ABC-type Fe3+-hydroxamate transport system substrate-binding protein
MAEETNLTNNLKKLEDIAQWFDEQQDIDVEQGLTKVKEAATLIKSSKARLAAIENEFQAIEKEISGDDSAPDPALVSRTQQQPVSQPTTPTSTPQDSDDPINLDDIPF